uniref:MAP7 domain containing 3 n=1 Tax=Oncorhynchus kisutch TaxID=8019 RepID=A0A8C7DXY4_ONCKI
SLSLSLSLSLCRVSLAASAQAQAEERRSLAGNSPVPASPATANTPPNTTAAKIDDRLRVAKERREEADRQQAAKDSQILERERKAKLQVERQMEERQKKLDEQRRKEEQRRSAVEEKRKQKQEEEKEHYEAVMRRTLERSQRVEQRQKRWSWGGLSESDNRSGKESSSIPFHSALYHMDRTAKFDKRSTSTMNLKQLSEAGINKRLSSSSATLINSPDKSKSPFHPPLGPPPLSLIGCNPPLLSVGPSLKKRSSSLTRAGGGKTQTPSKLDKGTTDDQARKPLASPVDGGFLSRLLTPTQASLARSKSAAALSAEGGDAPECHLCPRSASASPLHPVQRGPLRSRSIDRQKSATLPTSASADQKEKRFSSPGGKRPASPSNIAGRHRSPSPAPPPSDSAKPPSPQPTSAKPPPIQRPALTPTGPPTLRKRDSKPKDLCPIQPVVHQSPEAPQTSTTPTPTHTTSNKSMAGTNSAAEAAMILAENRRLAREKKEREEALRVLREEEEKLRKEEDKRLAEEDRLKRLEEEKRLAEERKKKEEEDALMAEADRERLEEEEAVRQAELQKEREEAEAQAAIEAEKVRIERERVMAQNQQERMERKKVGGESPFQLVHFIIHTDYFGFKCLFHLLTRRLPYTDWLSPSPSSPVPKGRLVEGSEFLNEDSNKLAPGLNGKPGPWSFEELIDLGGRNQGLIDCDGGPEGPRVAFEDKGIPVATLHPSSQPIEALSGERKVLWQLNWLYS